jgi:hypothetical protein
MEAAAMAAVSFANNMQRCIHQPERQIRNVNAFKKLPCTQLSAEERNG